MLALAIAASSFGFAQDLKYAQDTKSISSITKALYDVISGPIGQKRDWVRFKNLFPADAKMTAVVKRNTGAMVRRSFTPEEYIEGSSKYMEERGFFEREISNKTEQFDSIAHVFSTYESRYKLDDAKPFERGINSITLYNDGKRWWVTSITWQGEDSRTPLPAKYGG